MGGSDSLVCFHCCWNANFRHFTFRVALSVEGQETGPMKVLFQPAGSNPSPTSLASSLGTVREERSIMHESGM